MWLRHLIRSVIGVAIVGMFFATLGHAQTTLKGMTIPSGHPRLWYTPARLTAARAWFISNRFSASGAGGHDLNLERATECLLGQNAATCNAAVAWAMSVTLPTTGVSCDECRWVGENAILTFDWAYEYFTPSQRATFISNWNTWLAHWRDEAWGGNRLHANRGVPMYGSNYYWGYLRNELLWGIATAGENSSANDFLADALQTRWTEEFVPAAASLNPPYTNSHLGGVLAEGDQYGVYHAAYPSIPFFSAQLHGRNVYDESNFFNEVVFNIIYSTSMAPTTRNGSNMGYEVFPYNESEGWRAGNSSLGYLDFMNSMITARPSSNMTRWAKQWTNLNSTSVSPPHIRSTLPTLSPLSFSSLPLDYFAPGIGYFYGRNTWGASGTDFLWMLGKHGVTATADAATIGHGHEDIGAFQIWRNGRWLTRNDSSYGELLTGGADPGGLIGANTLLINGTNIRSESGQWTVRRLESRQDYSYATTEFTTVYGNVASTVQREFVFVRSLETTVVFDRINTGASTTKTWLAHFETNPTLQDASHVNAVNGSEALRVTHLVPASPTRRVVTEGGSVGQYRLEVDATGTQNYFLTTLQAKSASGAEINPTVVETASTYQVVLNGSISITFQKGASSSGGAITIANVTTPFTTSVQTLSVTPDGPVWSGGAAQSVAVPKPPTGLRAD